MDIKKLSIPRFICISLLLPILAAIQSSALARNGIFGITPDIILSAVIAVAYFEGPFVGGAAGIYAGLLSEAAGGSGLCLYPLLYMLLGYIIGALFVSSLSRNLLTLSSCVLLSHTLRSSILIFKAASANGFVFGHYLIRICLPEILLSAIFAIIVFLIVFVIHKLTHTGEK